MPREDAALRALPGVGPYTARAVRSFAFGDDVAAVDTNAVRVLARARGGHAARRLPLPTRLGDRLVPAGLSWEFNQAMFDLGATVCTRHAARLRALPPAAPVRVAPPRAAGPDPGDWSPTAPAAERVRRLGPPGEGPVGRGAPRTARWPSGAAGRGVRLAGRPGAGARVAASLVAEGFARWSGGRAPGPPAGVRRGPARRAGQS